MSYERRCELNGLTAADRAREHNAEMQEAKRALALRLALILAGSDFVMVEEGHWEQN
jgi:L-asparagine transporter-like permease